MYIMLSYLYKETLGQVHMNMNVFYLERCIYIYTYIYIYIYIYVYIYIYIYIYINLIVLENR